MAEAGAGPIGSASETGLPDDAEGIHGRLSVSAEEPREFSAGEKSVKQTVFEVDSWGECDETYNHVLLILPGGYRRRISTTDAQRCGQLLNRAGGGS